MSIACQFADLLAAAATTVPAVPVTPVAAPPASAEPEWVAGVVIAWAVLGLAGAWALGAFGRGAIAGPERLRRDESAWPLVAVLGAGFVALIVGAVLTASGLAAVGRHRPVPADLAQLIAGAAGDAVAATVVVLLLRERRPGHAGLGPIGLAPGRLPVAVAGGTAALFVLFPLVTLTSSVVEAVNRAVHAGRVRPHPVLQMMSADHNGLVTAVGVVTAVVVAPVCEELAFRSLMQTALARLFAWAGGQWRPVPVADALPVAADGPAGVIPLGYASADPALLAPAHTPAAARWAAVVVTSVAFAGVHGSLAFFLPIFVLSVGLGFVYERSGNLWMNMTAHALFNASQIVVFMTWGRA